MSVILFGFNIQLRKTAIFIMENKTIAAKFAVINLSHKEHCQKLRNAHRKSSLI